MGIGNFSKIPNGLPGVEHRLDLIFQGVNMGEISLGRWVDVTATTPAQMFGLFPQKGVIAPGSDADIVIYDPNGTHTISAATHHMNVDYSAYEGMEVRGKATTVLSRGAIIIENDDYVGSAGAGQFLERGLNGCLR
jgi:dihydropyrimidinase